MMNTLTRYLGRQILVSVAFVLLALVGLFTFFEFIDELSDVGRGTYRLQHALRLTLISVPARAYDLMPVAVLIGTIYTLAQLAAHSEFTIMRVSGMGTSRMLRTLMVIGIPIVTCIFLMGEFAAPIADQYGQNLRLRVKSTTASGKMNSGFWFRDATYDDRGEILARRYINIYRIGPDMTALEFSIYEFDADFHMTSILLAKQGRYEGGAWRLKDVVETRVTDPSSQQGAPSIDQLLSAPPQTYQLARTPYSTVIREAERLWKSQLTPNIVAVNMLTPERMPIHSLSTYLRYLKQHDQSTGQYEIAFWKKMTFPFSALVMMVLALPFAYLNVRSGGTSFKVFSGVMLGIAFYTLNRLFSHLGLLNTWPASITAILPSLVVFVGALIGLRWVGNR